MRTDSRPELADLKPVREDIMPKRANYGSERADFRLERADFRLERADFKYERADFRPERAWGGRTNGRTNEQTNKSPPVFYRTLSPSGPLPRFPSLQFTIRQSRARGIADHILPLGDLFPL